MNEERVEIIESAMEALITNGIWQRLTKHDYAPGPKAVTLLAYELEKEMSAIEATKQEQP